MAQKLWAKIALWLALVGGITNVLSSYNFFNLLGLFGTTLAPIIQLIAGGATIWIVSKYLF